MKYIRNNKCFRNYKNYSKKIIFLVKAQINNKNDRRLKKYLFNKNKIK